MSVVVANFLDNDVNLVKIIIVSIDVNLHERECWLLGVGDSNFVVCVLTARLDYFELKEHVSPNNQHPLSRNHSSEILFSRNFNSNNFCPPTF